jgi:MSHA biogenesis protein MshI
MDSIEFLKDKMSWIKLFKFKSPAARLGLCCIGITPQGFILSYTSHKADQTQLNLCESVQCDPKDFQTILTDMVNEYQLMGVNCVWMLQPEEYLLFTMEELPVVAQEFQAAIRWKIKKLLPYSIDDAVIDYFSIPAPLITNPKKNITVVVSQTSHLSPVAEQLNNAGLTLTSIDIPELGLRNIMSLYENKESSTALVYLREKNSLLLISRENEFYLSRRLDLDVKALINATNESMSDYLDRLALQLQRSFDYYHSQWRRPIPDKLLIVSPLAMSADTQTQLSERLSIVVTEVNLNEKLNCKNKLTFELQCNALAVIGGALRIENKHHATN